MKYQAILFDLDGTLLPQDQDVFIHTYFAALGKTMAKHGYDPEKLLKTVWMGTKRMIANDGGCTNEAAFWDCFFSVYGREAKKDIPLFESFYANQFDSVKDTCGYNPAVPDLIRRLKASGYRLALATNPLFPKIATAKRAKWAGVSLEDFEYCTTYENVSYCKPSEEYYRCIAEKLNLAPEACLMVGNDVEDDTPAKQIGMDVFLLTDFLINRKNVPIGQFPHGSFRELEEYILSAEV